MSKSRPKPRRLFRRDPPGEALRLIPLPMPPATDPSALRARVALDKLAEARATRPCMVCARGPCVVVGVWEPTGGRLQRRLAAPPGKVRLCIYGLCQRCYEHITPQELEQAILAWVDLQLQP
jgi:hypothetical protein